MKKFARPPFTISFLALAVGCLSGGPRSELASLHPLPDADWSGTWADGSDALILIDANGLYKADLVVSRMRLRPDYVYEDRRGLKGVLPANVLSGERCDFSRDGEYINAANLPVGGTPRVIPDTFALRLDPQTRELIAEYRYRPVDDSPKQYRLRRVGGGPEG